jgi:glutathione S-transferase
LVLALVTFNLSQAILNQEELEAPYEIKFYKRGSDLLAPKELRDVHPLGKSPVITYGDVTIAESGAIVGQSGFVLRASTFFNKKNTTEYIIRKFGNGKARPPASGEIDDLYCSCHFAVNLCY